MKEFEFLYSRLLDCRVILFLFTGGFTIKVSNKYFENIPLVSNIKKVRNTIFQSSIKLKAFPLNFRMRLTEFETNILLQLLAADLSFLAKSFKHH